MIYRKEEFVQDSTGDPRFPIKQVDVLTALDGSAIRYVGRVALNMQTPAGIQQIPVSFQIEVDSVEAAFEKYGEYAGPKIDEVKQHIEQRLNQLRQQQQSKIITPSQGQPISPSIINLEDFKRDD